MVAINNFGALGAKKTTGRVVFSNNIGRGLLLIVAESSPLDDETENKDGFNPCLLYEAGITREIHTAANGISYFHNAYEFCSNSKEHIKMLLSCNSSIFFSVPRTFKESFKSEEIRGDGFRAYTTKQRVQAVKGGEEWKEVWKVSFDNFRDFIRKL